MPFTFTNYAGMPTPKSPGSSFLENALNAYQQGLKMKYMPQQLEADIQQKQAASQKNMMIANILKSFMGDGEQESTNQGMRSDLRPAILKGILGIDPYLQSPQEAQNLKIAGELQSQANKNTLSTGASDVSREFLQDKVSMPQEYMGALGSITMSHDLAKANLGDKDAEERLIQAAVAEKLVPEYAGFQLMSQGQKATVHSLEHQKQAIRQGWPLASNKITNNLPPELQKEVERRHNEIVKGVNKIREDFFKAGGKERPDFETKEIKRGKGRRITQAEIEKTARARHMDENQVIDLLARKMNMSVDDFMNNVYKR